VNWLAVAVSAIAYFALGALWYNQSVFGKAWAEGHKLNINPEDAKEGMPMMMAKTLALNFIIAFFIGIVVMGLQSTTVMSGLKVGALCGVGLSFCTMAVNSVYTGKGINVLLIDGGYHVVGILISAVILSIWH
jgi:hypothetical protein